MRPLAETYDRLTSPVRALAGVLFHEPEVTSVAATVRFSGRDHEVRLERFAAGDRLTVRAGYAQLYRGKLAGFYGAKERAS